MWLCGSVGWGGVGRGGFLASLIRFGLVGSARCATWGRILWWHIVDLFLGAEFSLLKLGSRLLPYLPPLYLLIIFVCVA